jgi:hypothetical protein
VLDEIRKTVPRTVQLTHLGATAPATDLATDADISITGISSAVEPRKEAEALRIALISKFAARFKHVTSVFKNLDDGDQYVLLDGHRLATANFTLDFQIQVREPAATPVPAGAAHRSKGGDSE